MAEQALCTRLLPEDSPLSQSLLAVLEARGVLRRRNGLVFRPGFRPRYTPELAKIRDRLEVLYRRAGLEAPEDTAVEATFGPDAPACRQVMAAMTRQGVLIPLGAGCRIHRRPLSQARALLLELFQASPALTLARFRDAAGRQPEIRPAPAGALGPGGSHPAGREITGFSGTAICDIIYIWRHHGGRRVSGEPRGLQNRWGRRSRPGEFDPHLPPPPLSLQVGKCFIENARFLCYTVWCQW